MKIATFKSRFLELSKEDQQTAISEMKKATKEESTKGMKPEDKEEGWVAFQLLISWCEDNQKN